MLAERGRLSGVSSPAHSSVWFVIPTAAKQSGRIFARPSGCLHLDTDIAVPVCEAGDTNQGHHREIAPLRSGRAGPPVERTNVGAAPETRPISRRPGPGLPAQGRTSRSPKPQCPRGIQWTTSSGQTRQTTPIGPSAHVLDRLCRPGHWCIWSQIFCCRRRAGARIIGRIACGALAEFPERPHY